MTSPCGIVIPTGHTQAIKICALGQDTVVWHEDGMNKTVPLASVKPLPCCWIIGQGVNTPMKVYDLIKGPLARIGVEVYHIPMSRVTGLCNARDDNFYFTYEADGGYSDKRDKALNMLIHAWDEKKTVEYLTLAIQAVLEVGLESSTTG